jgi:hypothetical protein
VTYTATCLGRHEASPGCQGCCLTSPSPGTLYYNIFCWRGDEAATTRNEPPAHPCLTVNLHYVQADERAWNTHSPAVIAPNHPHVCMACMAWVKHTHGRCCQGPCTLVDSTHRRTPYEHKLGMSLGKPPASMRAAQHCTTHQHFGQTNAAALSHARAQPTLHVGGPASRTQSPYSKSRTAGTLEHSHKSIARPPTTPINTATAISPRDVNCGS